MRRLIRAACLALAITFAGSAIPAALAVPSGGTPPDKNVPTLAYYYQWFVPSSWSRAKTDLPLAGPYSSSDPSIARRQIAEAKQAGIDGFIVSWKSTPLNNRRLEMLITVAAESRFKLAVIYQGLDFHRRPLPVDRIAADLELFNQRYAPDPAFKIFDRPLLIWSGTWEFSAAELERTTRPLRPFLTILATEKSPEGYRRVADSFDGDAYYWSSVDPATNASYQARLNAISTVVHEQGGRWIAPFAPGFDARLVGGTREVPRRDGQTLRSEHDAAMASSPDALGLISWNEFSENTHVEPSVNYGHAALSVLASINEGRRVSISPLAADSDEQAGARGNSMTVQSGLAVLALLFVGVTAYRLAGRWPWRRRAVVTPEPESEAADRSKRTRLVRSAIVAIVVVGVAVTVAAGQLTEPKLDLTAPSPQYLGAQPVRNPQHAMVAAAGDISCPTDPERSGEKGGPGSCRMQDTARLIKNLGPDAVLALGDNQYPTGALKDFQQSYDRTWGAFRGITYPVAGNHEYGTPQAKGYYGYFGARAGDPDKGYYSFDLGPWHVVALNSECEHIGGCSDSSPQASWLKADLAAHPRRCTLAYWHRPRFSSGNHGNNLDNDALWRIVVGAGVDLVLNGHDHDYERFMPMNADGESDPAGGTAEIVAGTGGASHYKLHLPEPTSVARVQGENGVLLLDLSEGSYSWRFVEAPDRTVLDSGSIQCH